MKYSFKLLYTAILAFTVSNLNPTWSQELLVAPNGPITLGLGTIEDMAFSPDGKYIATASSRGITLWDAQTFNLIKTLYSSTELLYLRKTLGNVQRYSYFNACGNSGTSYKSSDGAPRSNTSYKSSDGTSYNWSRAIPARNPEEDQLCIKFSPDGDFITNGIEVWNINDGKVTDAFDDTNNWPIIPTNKIYSHSVEADYNSDDYISVYTLKIQTVAGESVATIKSQVASKVASSYPMSVHFSPDGKTLGVLWNTPGGKASGFPYDTSAVLYNLTKEGSLLRTLGHHFDWITSVTFSPDNNVVATTRWQAIDLWNVNTGQHLHTLDVPITLVEKANFSTDGNLVATTSKEEYILIWQVDTGELIFKGKGLDDFDNKSAFNFNSNNKFRISWDKEPDYVYEDYSDQYLAKVRLYDEEGHLLSEIPHDISVNSVDFNLEVDQLVSVGFDGLLLMDTQNQTFIEKLSNSSNHFPSITHAVFTLEDSIVTFHINGNICLWENPIPYDPYLMGWSSLGKLMPSKHQKRFFDLTISFDKRTIAARNVDGTVTLFPIDYSKDSERSNLPCKADSLDTPNTLPRE